MAPYNDILTFDMQQAIKPMSKNNASKFAQLLNEVLNTDLVDMLGAAFVTALKTNPTAERFTNILDLNVYENSFGNDIQFEGLRYIIAYLVYARYIRFSNSQDTFSGIVRPNRQESEMVSDGTLRAMQQEAKDIAVMQFKLLEGYLIENSDTYPEWEKGINRKSFKPRMINIRKTFK